MNNEPVSILHVAYNLGGGGAGVAAFRLHKGLRRSGIASKMYVATGKTGEDDVYKFQASGGAGQWVRRYAYNKARRFMMRWYGFSPESTQKPFNDDGSIFGTGPVRNMPGADVINLHWVSKFIDLQFFFGEVRGDKPVIWTLHDMNPFTGGCHYAEDCDRFTEHCGECPRLASTSKRDYSTKIWQRKKRAFSKLSNEDLHIVAPSTWMGKQVRKSSLLGNFPVTVIPYGLDTDVFAPRDSKVAKRALDVPIEAKVILFVAHQKESERKGFRLLKYALKELSEVPNLWVLSVGKGGIEAGTVGRHRDLGYVENRTFLSLIYNAADVFVIPSLQDNLPNTVLESLACGTPVIGFDVGGIPDMVRDGQTGFLVKSNDIQGLANCCRRVLEDKQLQLELSSRCREVVEKEYTLDFQAQCYTEIYENMLCART